MPGRKRILLIDHEPHLTAIVSAALEATGRYRIQRAAYDSNAISVAINFQPHLILLDAQPDHLELDALAQRIHAEQSLTDVPLLCLTNLAPNGQIGAVGLLAGYTFLANSFHLEQIINCLGQILVRKKAA
jgi:DNA-binding response OmpR family regulator